MGEVLTVLIGFMLLGIFILLLGVLLLCWVGRIKVNFGGRQMTNELSPMEKEVTDRIISAAKAYNQEVERAKLLHIKVLTTPCGDGKLKIRMIQVFHKLWELQDE